MVTCAIFNINGYVTLWGTKARRLMILTIDIGNTQIFAGVFDGDAIKARFRKTSIGSITSDELGIFLTAILREHEINPREITDISISSVVPSLLRTVTNCCAKYFGIKPFIVEAGIKTGIKIPASYDKLGADRVADCMAAVKRFPNQNLIVVDFGTANTFDAISKNKEYKGGAITVGVGTSLNALTRNTALLSNVEIIKPRKAAGCTTEHQLQSGLYYGHLGMIKEYIFRFRKECFNDEEAFVVATGGFARMFEKSGVFDCYDPDLLLEGIKYALEVNRSQEKKKKRASK